MTFINSRRLSSPKEFPAERDHKGLKGSPAHADCKGQLVIPETKVLRGQKVTRAMSAQKATKVRKVIQGTKAQRARLVRKAQSGQQVQIPPSPDPPAPLALKDRKVLLVRLALLERMVRLGLKASRVIQEISGKEALRGQLARQDYKVMLVHKGHRA